MAAESTALVPAAPREILPPREDWKTILELADTVHRSGLAPQLKSAAAVAVVMLKARELGIPPMHGLATISVVEGKPCCGAELMLGLIYKHHGDDAVRFAETDDKRCTIRYKRRSWPDYDTYSFSLDQARTAGILGERKVNWTKYPAAMLRARCISAVARMAFADSIGGMYTPEELGAPVVVQADGSVVLDAAAADAERGTVEQPRNVTPLRRRETGADTNTAPADTSVDEEELAPPELADTPERLDWISTIELAGRLDPKIRGWVAEKAIRSRNDGTLARAAASAQARIDESLARWQDAAGEMQERCTLGVANADDDKRARRLIEWASLLRGEHPDTARYAAANTPQSKLIDVIEEFWGVLGPEAEETAPEQPAVVGGAAPSPAADDVVPF